MILLEAIVVTGVTRSLGFPGLVMPAREDLLVAMLSLMIVLIELSAAVIGLFVVAVELWIKGRRERGAWTSPHDKSHIEEGKPLAQDTRCVIGNLPVTVIRFYLMPVTTGDWGPYSARLSKHRARKG